MKNLHRFLAILCMIILLPLSTWAQSHDYSQDYLTFNVITGGTIPWKSIGSITAKTIYYSINDGEWTSITSNSEGATISVSAGDNVRFKGNNNSYATSRDKYAGFDGGTATYNIQGNIMSLVYGDEFSGQTALTGTYNFCSIFKQSKAVSAENLILPATTLTNYCYRAMFSKAPDMAVAPALPATTLAQGCYWYMFEECPITTAPDLNARALVNECYGHMFENCSSLNHIKCIATSGFDKTDVLTNWVKGVKSSGTFVKVDGVTWSSGASGIPAKWTIETILDVPTIACDGFEIELSCITTGATIYYQLNHSGSYTPYTTAIEMTGDTFIECYSEKSGNTSATVSQQCEYDDRTLFEYSNQSLDTWTYNGNTITTPYSVNAIDGHSSSYATGTFDFETDVNLRDPQPTYLWFQHADQSAVIYVDDTEVEKHWGGYNAFFVDISSYVHKGTNHIKVRLKNNEGNNLAPASGDFNFNATLGNVKLFTSPCLPAMSYGYDGFHITSTVSTASATINVKTTIPTGASVKCTISGENCNYTETKDSTVGELEFSTTFSNPHLWNGTLDPYLYNVKLEIYHNNELYHSYERPYGLRFYEYVINGVNGSTYTGFLLNGQPYLLRGCCMHDDIAGKANALNDDDYTQTFSIIQELGCNFLRLAHYPHPKEVYDRCDALGIVVQTEVPCVNKLETTMPEAYWTHLTGQYDDMVNQHYNHPCIMFWGLSNEAKVTNSDEGRAFAKEKIEGYVTQIKALDSERMVGLVGHALTDPITYFGGPTNIDWIGSNLYQGWYQNQNSNNPTTSLNTCISNTINSASKKAFAFSEYGGGGTQRCHSETPSSTTNKGSGGARHDIEYQMWLHEGHIAAIKNKPELLFSSEWQLFDIAVYNRNEGYTLCADGENTTIDEELRWLNDKGLVERDHKTKKDTYYLYKAWWNQTDKFVHICGKDYEKLTSRVIKCYTNEDEGSTLTLFVNNKVIKTATVENNIATFSATNFNPGDIIKVIGATSNDTFTFANCNIFQTDGNWNVAANWNINEVPANGSNVEIAANVIIPADYVANVGGLTISTGSLTIADGGQLYHSNEGVTATVQKDITAYTVQQNQGETKTDGWFLIGYSFAGNGAIADMDNLLENEYDLFYYDEQEHYWRNYQNDANNFTEMKAASGYLYANSQDVTIGLKGTLYAGDDEVSKSLSYASTDGILKGFNLVGNPYAHNVTTFTGTNIADECYRMNGTRDELVVGNINGSNPLKAGEGFFVKATADEASITFNSGSKDEMKTTERINLEIRENDQLIDRLIVKRKGEPLEKITLNENSTKIFALHDNQKMAVIPIEGNELPVFFKTDKNGTYTISMSAENTTLYYLHLIDIITGDDVDLLTTPSYSFLATKMDYANRFKLVFNCGDANDDNKTFAFINNGDIIITADVEDATLQVIDLMGRVIMSRNVNVSGHVSTNGMTPGAYILRLISGNNVMTQKIVIR